MSPYTHHPNANIGNLMKIEHTTYNEAHGIRAGHKPEPIPIPKAPKTTAEKFKSFFSSKSQKKAEVAGTTRIGPGQVHISHALVEEEARFNRQQRERKAYEQAIKDAKKHEKPAKLSAHVPLYDWGSADQTRTSYQILGCDRPEKKITKSPRPVRSKFNTSPVRSKFTTATNSSTTRLADKRDPRAGSQGRLEHAPNKRIYLGPRPPSPGAQRPKKVVSRPPPKELRSVINNLNSGADLLDAKRRELKATFQKSAEKFRRSYGGDSDSDESFFCSGDPASTANSKKQSSPRVQLSTRVGGEARSCRLCHIRSPAGPRGICSKCEVTYCSPQPDVFDDRSDIPPPPPLKIRKSGLGLRFNGEPESPPPLPPVKESDMRRKVHDVRAKRTVATTPPHHRQSHRAVFEDIENVSPLKRNPSYRVANGRVSPIGKGRKTVSKSTRWPAEGMREAYGQNSGEGNTLKKSDSFYVFYDSMLRDLGASTPKSGVSPKRYDGL